MDLVLDLDYTLLQTSRDEKCAVLYEEQKEVSTEVFDQTIFKVERPPNTFYIKFRPGIQEFLSRVRKICHTLNIYTHATREYAKFIIDLLDPSGKLFDIVYTASDEPNRDKYVIAQKKDLRRLYNLVDGDRLKHVLILDDKPQVWVQHHQVISIFPYVFFDNVVDRHYYYDYPFGLFNKKSHSDFVKIPYTESDEVVSATFQDTDNVLSTVS